MSTNENTNRISARATHLICWRSSPFERRKRTTSEATEPTSATRSPMLMTASGISNRSIALM